MAKTINKKIDTIEDKIRKLKEQKKKMQEKLERQVGRMLIEEWGVEDIEEAKLYIQRFKEQVLSLKKSASSNKLLNKESNEKNPESEYVLK